ncbi:MAG: hypothetical protein QM704_10665 [Anaeromyxobacteraceae bacterium]
MKPYRAPRWVRALLAWDRVAIRANNIREGILDELLLAWIPPEDRAALTALVYAKQSAYLPGGAHFQGGLFGWERRALDAPPFPSSGRVLVGAAGAGREVRALVDRGFSVVAFDPCAPFADAARTLATDDRATFVQASYEDLVRAVEGRGGPLDFLRANPPFDMVILGWGSFSHVMPAASRLALLRALRALAPRAPVLISFALEPEPGTAPPGKGRVRGTLQRLFAALDAPGVSEVGDHFLSNGGFFSFLKQDALIKLAWDAGYEIVRFEEQPYAHAVLAPLGSAGAEATP